MRVLTTDLERWIQPPGQGYTLQNRGKILRSSCLFTALPFATKKPIQAAPIYTNKKGTFSSHSTLLKVQHKAQLLKEMSLDFTVQSTLKESLTMLLK